MNTHPPLRRRRRARHLRHRLRRDLGDQLRVTVIATGLSPAKRVRRAADAAWCTAPVQRTGTDNLPVLSSMAVPGSTPPGGHAGAAARLQPADARRASGATAAPAAAKVDALASNGMDEIEIPAFLRKQAD